MSVLDLSFSEAGEGPPLVILHGLFGNKRNWGAISKVLSKTYRVLSVDLRNHGESPWDEEMTYPAMAGDIAGLIEKQIGGPARVIGHSMGGKASMILALEQPDLVEELDVAGMTRRSEAEEALAPAIPERMIRTFLAQNLAPAEGGGLTWKINLDVIEKAMPNIEGFPDIDSDHAFEKPSLHLTGANSTHVLPRHHAEIERLFPNSEIEAIPDAGHWLHAEQPALFLEAVESFLS